MSSYIIERHPIPASAQKFLTEFGGKHPVYKKPNYRLVVASDVYIKEAGVYRDWDDNLSRAERGGFNFSQSDDIGVDMGELLGDQPAWEAFRSTNRPIRTVVEMREVQRYPHVQGWIIEKLTPPHVYGSPDEWYSYKAVDGVTPCLGEYPHQGDYEMIYGPFHYVPGVTQLQIWISKDIQESNKPLTGTRESRAIEYCERLDTEEKRQWMKRRAEYQKEMQDIWNPIATGTSLQMSRVRQQLAARAGQRSHVGILNRE